ncbi:GNAT family N-acetyltransferase [Streptomyces sp. NPDC046915]|uniref:GNAT family N-acetyltransferase n=1 Tax=Streptomyces sp. NPDC046915 TaxID=3155257 RepID=UPI0033E1F906
MDASTDAGPVPIHPDCPDPGGDGEDTLELRLPDELVALFTAETADTATRGGCAAAGRRVLGGTKETGALSPSAEDLLDGVGGWGPTVTPVGRFQLARIRIERDLPLISRWMNDPAVSAFWGLAGSPARTEEHLHAQLDGDGRSVPCVGMLDGVPMSYWEVYRADLDPLARHYPARPHDTGIHLLIGTVADRGRGLGSALLRSVADLVMDHRPHCARVVAEPDLRNTPSVAAFLSAGFRFGAEVDLPAKRAALMLRDRTLRHLM